MTANMSKFTGQNHRQAGAVVGLVVRKLRNKTTIQPRLVEVELGLNLAM